MVLNHWLNPQPKVRPHFGYGLEDATIIKFMRINLHRDLTLSELSQSVGLSRSHIFHLFKTESLPPPMQYLKALRMQTACELLLTTDLNIKQIMLEVGIKDESHFVRDFKRAYGVTPTEYRSQLTSRRVKTD
jgi:AraC-like DNA-binding protein